MTDKKLKSETVSPLRIPKPKNKLGLKVPQIPMPHEDIIRADVSPELKILKSDSEDRQTLPSLTRLSSQTRQTNTASQPAPAEIAPTKNFQKVANSITKQAIPEGWFKGKSKQLYDALYTLTRGAIVPVRKVRIQKSKLMKLAGIGSRITFDSNIQHLIRVGLIQEIIFTGEHEGNEFEVLLPEEATLTRQTSQTSLTSPAQKLDRLVRLETSQTSQSPEPINTGVSGIPKTSFKTLRYNDDDAPIIGVLERLNEAARKVTGKDLTRKDLEKLGELAELLISETIMAAARTQTVSSFIAFMAENLRRRLYAKPRPADKREIRPGHLDVGKGSGQKNEAEVFWMPQTPLTAEQRQNTLKALQEAKAADSIFFREFKTYGEIEYTPDDFKWIIEKLEGEVR